MNHIDHLVKIAGVNHVGIGTDFNAGGGLLDCQDVSQLSANTQELARRGYSDCDIRKIPSTSFSMSVEAMGLVPAPVSLVPTGC